jgi:F-type H+-transporting ATPase subunit b
MTNELLFQLGINWKLFLSQAVNFFILLLVLTFFVYKPLIKIIKERSTKIKEGLDKAEEADVRLKEIDVIGVEKIKEAEQKGIEIIKATENKAKVLDKEILDKAEKKQKEINELLKQSYTKQQEEARTKILAEAGDLIKKVIVKTVELKPEAIDEALIKKAVAEIKENEKA